MPPNLERHFQPGIVAADPVHFLPGAEVEHTDFGRGTVEGYGPGIVIVLFERYGYRMLSLEPLTSEGWLAASE